MNEVILKEIKARGITRLCHFTKSKNLSHILNDFNGIIATDELPELYKDINDSERYDGKLEYVCCSIQYPNFFYLQRIKESDILFKDWVILCIDPNIILKEETMFSKVNAATERGKYITGGIEGFRKLFSQQVSTNKRSIVRSLTIPNNCTTDIQAEVLVNKIIPKQYIKGIIVKTEKQAKEEHARMKIWQIKEDIPIIISPELFTKDVYKKIALGQLPDEKVYNINS